MLEGDSHDDDIVLVSNSPEGLQRQDISMISNQILKTMSVDLTKIDVMVFNNTRAWEMRSKPKFFFAGKKLAYRRSYIHRTNTHRASVLPTRH